MREKLTGRVIVLAVVSLLLIGCSSDDSDDRDTSISLEQLATEELGAIPGVVEVRAAQTAADPTAVDRSDPYLWSLDVQVSLDIAATSTQASEAAEAVRAFIERHHGDQRWAAQLIVGQGGQGDDVSSESPIQVEVWPDVRTSASADTRDLIEMSKISGIAHVATAQGSFALRAGSATVLPDVMTTLRALPSWDDGGSVHTEEGRVRIMDVPDRVTDTQLQAIIAIAIAYPTTDVEISAPATGDQQPVLFLNRLSAAEAAEVVATLTDPRLVHTSDDGYQLTFALRSEAGDVTGTVGAPGEDRSPEVLDPTEQQGTPQTRENLRGSVGVRGGT